MPPETDFDPNKFVAQLVTIAAKQLVADSANVIIGLKSKLLLKKKVVFQKYSLAYWKSNSRSRTFLHREPTLLSDYYVACGLRFRTNTLDDPTLSELKAQSKSIIVTGTGGTGKSIFIKHLSLQCIREYSAMPILFELRELNDNGQSLAESINASVKKVAPSISKSELEQCIKSGLFYIFLDGYDEVNEERRAALVTEIESLRLQNEDMVILVTSRPDDRFADWKHFKVFSISPLTLNKAVQLIEKIDYECDIKDKFLKDLRTSLFNEHKSFLSNPLLLSIMLITYGRSANIPSRLSSFYSLAFEALFQRHDALKDGSYSRDFLSNLEMLDFQRIFSGFCLRSYHDRKVSMTKEEALNYIRKAKTTADISVNEEHLLKDSSNCVCLLCEEGLNYVFTHRSFQEYFTAKFIANASLPMQKLLIEALAQRIVTDSVMDLLYELRQDIVDQYLIIPQIKILRDEISNGLIPDESAYKKYILLNFKFLKIEGDSIRASASETSNGFYWPRLLQFSMARHCDKVNWSYSKPKDFCKTHGAQDKVVSVDLEEIPTDSALWNDLMKTSTSFSYNYLKKAFMLPELLEKKYIVIESSLDEILAS